VDTGSSNVPSASSSSGTLISPAISSRGMSSILRINVYSDIFTFVIILLHVMLILRFFVVATLWGVLLSDEQVQWNQFRDFMIKYQKSYRNDLQEAAKRFEVFKVNHARSK